jgi:hypothetical protein
MLAPEVAAGRRPMSTATEKSHVPDTCSADLVRDALALRQEGHVYRLHAQMFSPS